MMEINYLLNMFYDGNFFHDLDNLMCVLSFFFNKILNFEYKTFRTNSINSIGKTPSFKFFLFNKFEIFITKFHETHFNLLLIPLPTNI